MSGGAKKICGCGDGWISAAVWGATNDTLQLVSRISSAYTFLYTDQRVAPPLADGTQILRRNHNFFFRLPRPRNRLLQRSKGTRKKIQNAGRFARCRHRRTGDAARLGAKAERAQRSDCEGYFGDFGDTREQQQAYQHDNPCKASPIVRTCDACARRQQRTGREQPVSLGSRSRTHGHLRTYRLAHSRCPRVGTCRPP